MTEDKLKAKAFYIPYRNQRIEMYYGESRFLCYSRIDMTDAEKDFVFFFNACFRFGIDKVDDFLKYLAENGTKPPIVGMIKDLEPVEPVYWEYLDGLDVDLEQLIDDREPSDIAEDCPVPEHFKECNWDAYWRAVGRNDYEIIEEETEDLEDLEDFEEEDDDHETYED